MIKKTREELNKMTDKQLLNLDITTKEEEAMIQEIRNSRITTTTQPVKFNHAIIPDIKNPTQESEWQEKVNEFNSKNTPVEAKIVQAEKILETVKTEVQSIPVPENITVPEPTPRPQTVPFCDSCDSKGVSHKKICPKNPKNLTPTTPVEIK